VVIFLQAAIETNTCGFCDPSLPVFLISQTIFPEPSKGSFSSSSYCFNSDIPSGSSTTFITWTLHSNELKSKDFRVQRTWICTPVIPHASDVIFPDTVVFRSRNSILFLRIILLSIWIFYFIEHSYNKLLYTFVW